MEIASLSTTLTVRICLRSNTPPLYQRAAGIRAVVG